MREPWEPAEGSGDDEAARQDAYRRLADAARRVGMSLEHLSGMMRQVAHNEVETRRFLADQVYGVPDSQLDALLRGRLAEGSEGA